MDTGLKLSLAGHAAVLALALVGWPFGGPRTPPEPVVMDVALYLPGDLTLPVGAVPQAPESPDEPPEPPVTPETPPPPPPEDAPETSASEAAAQPDPVAPLPPPVDRVAPVPQPEPPDPVREADTRQPEVAATPDPAPEAEPAEEQDATAPEAAAPEIVTEATDTDDAPTPPAPRQRPDRPVSTPLAVAPDPEPEPAPEPEPEQEPEPEPEPKPEPAAPPATDTPAYAVSDAVAAALADALGAGGGGSTGATDGSLGGSLTAAERDGLRLAVGRCWNVGALGTDAMQVIVTVAMDMGRDGTPSNLRLLSHTGGGESAAQQAYDTARRAILRCAPFDLPQDRYDQWRRIEMTFNPADMGRR